MKRKLLMTGAIIALLAGMNAASAQTGGQQGGEQPRMQNAPSGGPQTIKPGVHEKEPGASVQRDQKEKSKVGQGETGGRSGTQEKTGQQGQSKEKIGQQPSPGTTQQGAQPQQGTQQEGKASASTVRSVQLSTDQRTKIATTIKMQRVERATNINFDIRVGAVVPRTVRYYPLPIEIVEIVPAYRGYDYVLVGDEILIIDPVTFEIVAVLPA